MSTFISRLWTFRIIRFAAWSFITLITLYVLTVTYVNWSGSRRWLATKAMIQKEGETLDFNTLLPKRVEDSKNFCAIEPLFGINGKGESKSAPDLKRIELEKCGWENADSKLGTTPTRGVFALGRHVDLAAWSAYLTSAKYISLPAQSGNAAGDLLAALDTAHPLLKQLSDVATARTEAVFVPILVPTRPLFSMPFHHFNGVRKVSSALVLRAQAACESGNTAAACDSTLAVLRLTDASAREPFLISELIATSLHEMALESIWTVLNKRQATDEELQALQSSLSRLDFHKAVLTAMRSEMASAVDSLEFVQAGPFQMAEVVNLLSVVDSTTAHSPSWIGRCLWSVLPVGLIDHNKAVIVNLEYEKCIAPLKRGNTSDMLRLSSLMETEVKGKQGLMYPDHVIANLVAPAYATIFQRMCRAEAYRRQALVACALERYFIQHHSYPLALPDLIPGLLAQVPADPVDDKPLRYRQTADGRYMLWSIGFDETDDGGKVNADATDKQAVSKMQKAGYKGDWTWQYLSAK